MREKRKEKVLRAASDKLYYDIWMLLSTAAEMSSGKIEPGVINNALLESFLIHTRIILDFLYPEKENKKPHKEDIIADDFFDDPKTWGGKKDSLLSTIHKRVGKEIAHLSYLRLEQTQESKQWEYLQIAREIGIIFDQFIEQVSTSLLGSRWDETHRNELEVLSQLIEQRNQQS